MRLIYSITLAFALFSSLAAQIPTPNFWAPVAQEAIVLPATAQRTIQPSALAAFQLDYNAMEAALKQAPMEFTREARERALLLDLPMADGSMRNFKVVESPVMAPELTAKFPAIHTYSGIATDGSGTMVRLGVGYNGFHAFIFGDDLGIQSVRPYADGQHSIYMSYKISDLPSDPATAEFICGTDDFESFLQHENTHSQQMEVAERGGAEPVQLKVYRAAIAAKGEYSVFHGGTKPLVLSAITVAMNFINAILERDFDVRYQLIPNNDLIIFLDPATDPYTGETVGDWMSQNPGAINPIIGLDNYDIGHVFSQYSTGDQVGVVSGRVCQLLTKGRGCSSAPSPNAEYFFLVAAHEMCHQLSGGHSWNNCPGAEIQIAEETAFEPGSGTTIMSYAGSCGGGNNIQGDSDPYFHVGSIVQVRNFVATGDGNLCGETLPTNNNTPVAATDIPALGLYLPISTPFVLTGSGSDPDGDVLNYCWEQYDLGPSVQLGLPTGTAPSFRSFSPVPIPSRTFPRIQTVISNNPSNAEVLPTYNRLLTFRMTVRDNQTGGGGVDWVEVKMQSTTTAGPFRVTYPNELITWNVGENQIVTWDVANTDGSLVNCKSVNIHLSTDGGLTYPVMLASGVPNTGSYCIEVPNNVTNNARIRVQADDHIFFDISNANFRIQQPQTAGFSVCGVLKDQACLPNGYTTEINTSSAMGFNTPITLSIAGLPAGATGTFSPNPVMPGSNSTLTIEFAQGQPETTFTATVEAVAGTSRTYDLVLSTISNDFAAFELLSPADGASGVNISPVLSWNGVPDANVYEVEVASSPSFEAGTLVAADYSVTADNFDIPVILNQGQEYYWRARPKNECGVVGWSGPFVFIVQIQTCLSFSATDLPKNISANGTPTVESVITIPSGGAVSDVNVKKVQGTHNFFGDLEVRLVRPTGGNVLLFKNRCSSYAGNFNIAFDDVANAAFTCPPPQNGAVSKPTENLSAFNGQNAAGQWILQVKDNQTSSGGQLTGFELELCSGVSLTGPFIVNNNTLQLPSGTNAAITTSLLRTDDANNTAAQLTYTLITVPEFGILENSGSAALKAGDQFKQADIDNGAIRYFDFGFNTSTDEFRFAVTDGEGGLASGTFTIQTTVSGTKDLTSSIVFDLAPNPADESVRISFGEALSADTHITLFNTAGQLLRSQTLSSGNVSLVMPVSDLPQGIYTVLVSNSKATGVRKLVVK